MSAHPLDPLSTEEFRQAAAILRRDQGVGDRWRLASIELREPSKQTVREFEPGGPIIREALVVCWNRDDGQAFKAVVSLTEDRVLSWEPQPGEQPNLTVDEWHEADHALREDPHVIEALARRGITDMSLTFLDTWGYRGALIPDEVPGTPDRVGRRMASGDGRGQSVCTPGQRAAFRR